MFTHLHGHSTFSFLEAIGKPKHIVATAKELWMQAIAITDYNGIYWAIAFFQEAKANDIVPIIWTEVWFVVDISSWIDAKYIGNICLLAINKEGYLNLVKLISYANKEGAAGKPKVDVAILKAYSEGIILFMGGDTSWIWKMVAQWEREEKIGEILLLLQDAVGKEHVYLEVIAQRETLLPEIQKANTCILALAEKYTIPCIVASNYFYEHKEDKETWEVALAIKDGYKIYDAARRKPKWEYHIMSEKEIRDICKENWYQEKDIEQRIINTASIASCIDVTIELWQTLFPKYESPEEIKELYEKYKDQLIEQT